MNIDAYNTTSAIHDLDNLVWDIRRYCQYTQNHLDGLREAQISEINRDFYKQNKHKFRIHHDGELEEIITKGKPSDLKKREALLWANRCYGNKKRNTVTHNTFSSVEMVPEWTEEIDNYVYFSRLLNSNYVSRTPKNDAIVGGLFRQLKNAAITQFEH